MCNNYQIITDATADLSCQLTDKNNIYVIPMSFIMGNKAYNHFFDEREIAIDDIYSNLKSGVEGKTSGISIGVYKESFRRFLEAGKDILYLCFSSGLSSTIFNAKAAADELEKDYPMRKIYCIDTLCASSGQGLLVYTAANRQKNGESLEDLAHWCEDNKLKLCHWFTVDDLEFLHRGGRVSKAVAVLGGALQIKPVMNVDNSGHLALVEKARGRKHSLEMLAQHLKNDGVDIENQTVFIGHGGCEQDAKKLAEYIEENKLAKAVNIFPIGPVVGIHSGPGTVALFFFGSKR